MSNSLWPHGLQQDRLPCPSPTPGAYSNCVHRVHGAIQPSHPLLSASLPPAIFPSIRAFSNESALPITWPTCWSFSFLLNWYMTLIRHMISKYFLLFSALSFWFVSGFRYCAKIFKCKYFPFVYFYLISFVLRDRSKKILLWFTSQGVLPTFSSLIGRDTCIPMFIASLRTMAKTWKQLKCPSTDEWIKKMCI